MTFMSAFANTTSSMTLLAELSGARGVATDAQKACGFAPSCAELAEVGTSEGREARGDDLLQLRQKPEHAGVGVLDYQWDTELQT